MSCTNCNDAAMLSMLDTVNRPMQWNTYQPQQTFLPLTTQFQYRITPPNPQQTTVGTSFQTQPTLMETAALQESPVVEKNAFIESVTNEQAYRTCYHPEIGSILIPAEHACPVFDEKTEEVVKVETKDVTKTVEKVDITENELCLKNAMEMVQKIVVQMNNDETSNALEDYVSAWLALITPKEQSVEMVKKFKEYSIEVFGKHLVSVFHKNIVLRGTYKKVKHLVKNPKQKTTLHQFYEMLE
jgi:hypothetical protein